MKPGQAIPAGLHVRMNIATGLKEARLLEDPALSHENFVKRLREQDAVRKKKIEGDPLKKTLEHLNHNAVMAVMEEKSGNSPPDTGKIAKDLPLSVRTKVEEIIAEEGFHDQKIGKEGVGMKSTGLSKNIFILALVLGIGVSALGLVYNKRRSRLVKTLSPSDKILRLVKTLSPSDKIL